MGDQPPPRDANLSAGFDEESPYDGIDISTLPEWWQRNIEEFREHGMRPYRPPRFSDGTLSPELRSKLEEEYGVSIEIRSSSPERSSEWEIVVDGELRDTVEHYRSGDGYSAYNMEAEKFRSLVRDAVEEA